jgi:DNA-binding NtrC family response regulator
MRHMTQDVQQHTTQLTDNGDVKPIEPASTSRAPIPALTIVYHPMLRRIGDRAILAELAHGRAVEISRHEPDFSPPCHAHVDAPLGSSRLSRTPFELRPYGKGGVGLEPCATRTKLVVDGRQVTAPRHFSRAELERGVIIELGDCIALLLHLYQHFDESGTGDLGLVGHSPAIARVREDIRHVAGRDVPVLIRGESGTGKELVASAIHATGARRNRPLVSVNLAAVPPALAAAELFGATRGAFTGAARNQEGYFRRAHGGTLFLDEIGEAPVDVQLMLLRAIETGEICSLGAQRAEQVDVRLVSATDANLEQNGFRAPLLYRLAGYVIYLPPLRARRDDIARLVIHFLGLELAEIGEADRLDRSEPRPWLPMSLMTRLVRFDWPGNVRQLRHALEQLVIANRGRSEAELPECLTRQLDGATRPDLPPDTDDVEPGPPESAAAEWDAGPDKMASDPIPSRRRPSEIPDTELAEALRVHHWDKKATAQALGIARGSLYTRIEASGLVRTVGELDVEEIRTCYHETGGNLDQMVERLCVSKNALRRRLKELGRETARPARAPGQPSNDEIRACHDEANGDVAKMAERSGALEKEPRRRINKPSLK